MVCTMAHRSFLHALCALPMLLPGASAHMQMEEPSPLRDPHSNRSLEPKDYNILTPLHSDGSDFSCKGYQWNTPLTPVATYQAGGTYELKLKGGATHGGGSCQISLSCDNGINFKVLKSIVGGCPIQKSYGFTIPQTAASGQCLLAWTWFNRVGNREMYMNCAVVDIVGTGRDTTRKSVYGRVADTAVVSAAAAQAALDLLPDLHVANLAGINDCKTRETVDLVFDDPGADVAYGGDVSGPSISGRANKGVCAGLGRKSAGPSISSSSPGANEQWNGDNGNKKVDSEYTIGPPSSVQCNDGQYHAECYGKPSSQEHPKPKEPEDTHVTSSSVKPSTGKPKSNVEKELEEYLAIIGEDDSMRKSNTEMAQVGSVDDVKVIQEEPTPEVQAEHSVSDPDTDPSSYEEVDDSGYSYDEDQSHFYEYDYSSGLRRQQTTRQAKGEEVTSILNADTGFVAPELELEVTPSAKPFSDEATTIEEPFSDEVTTIEEPSNPSTLAGTALPAENFDYNEFEDIDDDEDWSEDPEIIIDAPSHASFADSLPIETIGLDFDELIDPENLPNPEELPELEDPSVTMDILELIPEEVSQENTVEFSADIQSLEIEELSEPDTLEPLTELPSPDPNLDDEESLLNFDRNEGYPKSNYKHLKHHQKTECSRSSACTDTEPVIRYVKPSPEWYLSHAQPPSAATTAALDCEEVVWNCDGCRSPNRCIKVNACTRSCTRMPYTYLPTSTVITVTTSTPPPAAANISDSSPSSFLSSTPAPIPIADLEAAAPQAEQCSTSPIPYATGDPADYLPCRPGTFICKSETQFYACGQFEGSDWTYGALQDVSLGMICEPRLEESGVSFRKRQDAWSYEGEDGSGVPAPEEVAELLQELEDLSEKIAELYEAAAQKAEGVGVDGEEEEGVIEEGLFEEDVAEEDTFEKGTFEEGNLEEGNFEEGEGLFGKSRRAADALGKRQTDEDDPFVEILEFSDGFDEVNDVDGGHEVVVEQEVDGWLDEFEEPPVEDTVDEGALLEGYVPMNDNAKKPYSKHQLSACIRRALIKRALRDEALTSEELALADVDFEPMDGLEDGDIDDGNAEDTCISLIEAITNKQPETDIDFLYQNWVNRPTEGDNIDYSFDSLIERKSKRQDVYIPGFQYSDGYDGGDGIDDDAEALFNKPSDPLYEGLVDPEAQPQYDPYSENVEDIALEDEEYEVEDEGEDESEDIEASTLPSITSSGTTTPALEPIDIESSNNDEIEEFRKRQSVPNFQYSNGKDGGDGIDADPNDLFGTEPSGFEKYWPVASDQKVYTPHISPSQNVPTPARKPAAKQSAPKEPPAKVHARQEMHIWDTFFEAEAEGDAQDVFEDDFGAIFPEEEPTDALYEWLEDPGVEEDIYLVDTEPIKSPVSGILEAPTVATAIWSHPTAASNAIVAASATAVGETPLYPLLNSTVLAGTNVTTSISGTNIDIDNGEAETLSESQGSEALDEEREWEYADVSADPVVEFLPEAATIDDSAAVLPYLISPGPVIPAGVSVDWPGPENLWDSVDVAPPPVSAETVVVGVDSASTLDFKRGERNGRAMGVPKTEAKIQDGTLRRVAKQVCPPVPEGYYRADQYVKKA